jgi:hypothetical protein
VFLEIRHLGVSRLSEAGGEEVHAAYGFGDAVVDELGHDVRRHAGNHMVDRAFDVENTGVTSEPFDLRVLRVHGVHSRKAELHEREKKAHADACEARLLLRDAGDGDGPRMED